MVVGLLNLSLRVFSLLQGLGDREGVRVGRQLFLGGLICKGVVAEEGGVLGAAVAVV